MVPAQDGDSIAVPQLESHEQGDGLDRVIATVDIVPREKVVSVW
jgi:hypothetical protein